jgi:colanic acid/amylovoran biosynthesis protein
MSVKIVIANHGSRLSKGDSALLNSRIKLIKQFIKDAEFTVFTFNPEISYKPEMKYLKNVKISFYEAPFRVSFSLRALHKLFFSVFKIIFSRPLSSYLKDLKEFRDASLIISTGGDVLTEDYGLVNFINYAGNLLIGIFLKRPVVIFAETIGPFKHKICKAIARYLLNHASLITVRGEESKEYLTTIGIDRTPQYLTADTAFLLEPAPLQVIEQILERMNIRDDDLLVGVTVSELIPRYGFPEISEIKNKYAKYVEIMASITNYIIEKLGATVVFIPSVTGPTYDDRRIADAIFKLVKNKSKVKVIKDEYTCEEIKGIIGKCSMFIGARMHVTIFSTSQYVPTIAIAYSCKTYEVLGSLTNYIIDIRGGLEYNTFISMINEMWFNKEKIRESLVLRMREVHQKALLNGILLRNLLLVKR